VKDGSNADLSPDGRRLVFERAGQIFIADGDEAGASELPRPPRRLVAHYGDSWPTFLPDGKWVAVFLAEEGRYGDYWIVPSDGDEPRRVTSDFQEGGPPAWTPDGKSLVVPSARAGSMNLWRVPVGGGAPEALTTGSGDDLDPIVSSDGRQMLFTNVKCAWEVVVRDLERGVQTSLLERRTPLVFPRYSPDGRAHCFVSEEFARRYGSLPDGRSRVESHASDRRSG
jgi:Tol biopolymer transport system component